MAGQIVRVTTLLRDSEKKGEQQQQAIDSLEKIRDSHTKHAAENAMTVSKH